jgi:Na+/H+ antiporter NhaD/arsenite permease-like protein
MITLILSIFAIGYLTIILEHPLKLEKTVPALIMAILCWSVIAVGHVPLVEHHNQIPGLESTLLHHIGKIAEIFIFLISAMTIVELVDLHEGFYVLTKQVKTHNKVKLLWLISGFSFILSSVLDNLTTTIVMISLLRSLVPDHRERWFYVSLIVIASNAGGAWSPIGDVTTTMLWIGDFISTGPLIAYLIIPSILSLVVPLIILSFMPYFKGDINLSNSNLTAKSEKKLPKGSTLMLIVGLAGLLFVPIFKTITHLPPYMGIMLSLGVVWLVSEYIQKEESFDEHKMSSARRALSRIDTSSALFFLGILLAVSALESVGILGNFASALDAYIPSTKEYFPGFIGTDLVVLLLGFFSAIIDNVPLVAAAMSMYSLEEFPIDHKLWHFLAYSAGTGGSLLIIGSAAGVAAMGMEKINFMWYLKKISWIALIGFLVGAFAFIALHPIIEQILGTPEIIQNSAIPNKH